jgi:hypothetical protein
MNLWPLAARDAPLAPEGACRPHGAALQEQQWH